MSSPFDLLRRGIPASVPDQPVHPAMAFFLGDRTAGWMREYRDAVDELLLRQYSDALQMVCVVKNANPSVPCHCIRLSESLPPPMAPIDLNNCSALRDEITHVMNCMAQSSAAKHMAAPIALFIVSAHDGEAALLPALADILLSISGSRGLHLRVCVAWLCEISEAAPADFAMATWLNTIKNINSVCFLSDFIAGEKILSQSIRDAAGYSLLCMYSLVFSSPTLHIRTRTLSFPDDILASGMLINLALSLRDALFGFDMNAYSMFSKNVMNRVDIVRNSDNADVLCEASLTAYMKMIMPTVDDVLTLPPEKNTERVGARASIDQQLQCLYGERYTAFFEEYPNQPEVTDHRERWIDAMIAELEAFAERYGYQAAADMIRDKILVMVNARMNEINISQRRTREYSIQRKPSIFDLLKPRVEETIKAESAAKLNQLHDVLLNHLFRAFREKLEKLLNQLEHKANQMIMELKNVIARLEDKIGTGGSYEAQIHTLVNNGRLFVDSGDKSDLREAWMKLYLQTQDEPEDARTLIALCNLCIKRNSALLEGLSKLESHVGSPNLFSDMLDYAARPLSPALFTQIVMPNSSNFCAATLMDDNNTVYYHRQWTCSDNTLFLARCYCFPELHSLDGGNLDGLLDGIAYFDRKALDQLANQIVPVTRERLACGHETIVPDEPVLPSEPPPVPPVVSEPEHSAPEKTRILSEIRWLWEIWPKKYDSLEVSWVSAPDNVRAEHGSQNVVLKALCGFGSAPLELYGWHDVNLYTYMNGKPDECVWHGRIFTNPIQVQITYAPYPKNGDGVLTVAAPRWVNIAQYFHLCKVRDKQVIRYIMPDHVSRFQRPMKSGERLELRLRPGRELNGTFVIKITGQ